MAAAMADWKAAHLVGQTVDRSVSLSVDRTAAPLGYHWVARWAVRLAVCLVHQTAGGMVGCWAGSSVWS